jgi:ketosteroid isomerase-like protein
VLQVRLLRCRVGFAYLVLILLVFTLVTHLATVEASFQEEQYTVRKTLREYVRAMNQRSLEDIVALYASNGKFVDETFDEVFSGSYRLRNLYDGIFETNPHLVFTAFPWRVEVAGDDASVDCSWSLVGNVGVYNGMYYISMSKTSLGWKITEIDAHITVIHNYHLPYVFTP